MGFKVSSISIGVSTGFLNFSVTLEPEDEKPQVLQRFNNYNDAKLKALAEGKVNKCKVYDEKKKLIADYTSGMEDALGMA